MRGTRLSTSWKSASTTSRKPSPISTRAKSCTPGKTHRPLESLRPSRTVVTQPESGTILGNFVRIRAFHAQGIKGRHREVVQASAGKSGNGVGRNIAHADPLAKGLERRSRGGAEMI